MFFTFVKIKITVLCIGLVRTLHGAEHARDGVCVPLHKVQQGGGD